MKSPSSQIQIDFCLYFFITRIYEKKPNVILALLLLCYFFESIFFTKMDTAARSLFDAWPDLHPYWLDLNNIDQKKNQSVENAKQAGKTNIKKRENENNFT